MAFGQQSGPPASAKQMKYLLSLVHEAGHDGFRDARHPLGLTQRQAGGKFTTREASELIDRLVAGEFATVDDEPPPSGPRPDRPPRAVDLRSDLAAERAQQRLDDQRAELIAGVPADDLAVELERRGWTCTPPVEPAPRTRRGPGKPGTPTRGSAS